jgi:hypothetical protein
LYNGNNTDYKRGGAKQSTNGGVMNKRSWSAALWLLLIPYIGLLWVPFYNFREPAFLGFPFFYWYQLAWVPLTSFLIWIAYRSVRNDD